MLSLLPVLTMLATNASAEKSNAMGRLPASVVAIFPSNASTRRTVVAVGSRIPSTLTLSMPKLRSNMEAILTHGAEAHDLLANTGRCPRICNPCRNKSTVLPKVSMLCKADPVTVLARAISPEDQSDPWILRSPFRTRRLPSLTPNLLPGNDSQARRALPSTSMLRTVAYKPWA